MTGHEHNLTLVHAAHCCPRHGCKYGDDDCPVESGAVQPKYPNNNGCEICETPEARYQEALERILRTARVHEARANPSLRIITTNWLIDVCEEALGEEA